MLRALASLVIAAAAVGAGAAVAGNLGGVIALALVLLVALAVRLLFARFAHAMFRAGRMNEARRYYRVLAIAAWRSGRRAAARVRPARCAASVAFRRWRSVSKLSSTASPLAMPSMKSAFAMSMALLHIKSCAVIAHCAR